MKDKPKYFKNKVLQKIIDNSKLIIFDINGLIIDDEAIQFKAVNIALSTLGFEPINEIYWINNCVGHRADTYFREYLHKSATQFKNNTQSDIEKVVLRLIKEKNHNYANILKSKLFNIVRPGVLDFIKYLYEIKSTSSLKLAIATSAVQEEVNTIIGIDGLNISHYFDYIVTGSDIKNSKPDPEIYIKVIQMAKIEPCDGLVFEDSEMGVESAYRAGLKVIAIPNDFTKNQNFEKAKYIITDLTAKATIAN